MKNKNFVTTLEDFRTDFSNVSDVEVEILKHKEELKDNLKRIIQDSTFSISEQNDVLLNITNDLKTSIKITIDTWDKKLSDLLPMKILSEKYANRIIFLIFGKVNAGKSSFANFLTDLFPSDQIKRFYFDNGAINYFQNNQGFAEGITETTATIQGVELGKNFVLLDSPGLHSVTQENGELTQKFIDSTDAVLWLTPSTSPGQVQELNDLKIELEKGKPLQPVITRSDILDEDECPITGELIQILKNKTPDNRKLQEQDVLNRISDTNLKVPVKEPVSISVHAYKEAGKTTEASDDAGLTILLEKMVVLIDEAKVYKVGKAKSQMVSFLEKHVLEPLNQEVKPKIDSLTKQITENTERLKSKKQFLTSILISDISAEVPKIIENHKQTQDKNAIVSELSQLIENHVNKVLQQELSEFVNKVKSISYSLSKNTIGDFEDITIDINQVKGSGWKAASSGIGGTGGALGGAALGSMLLPGVGTLIGIALGGLLGGGAGSAIGNEFMETEVVTEKIDISSYRMVSKIQKSIKETLPTKIDEIFDDAINSIHSVHLFAKSISEEISRFSDEVQTIKAIKL